RRDILDSSRNRSSFRTNSEFRAAGSTPCRVSTPRHELLARARSKPIWCRAREALTPAPRALSTYFGSDFLRTIFPTRLRSHEPTIALPGVLVAKIDNHVSDVTRRDHHT